MGLHMDPTDPFENLNESLSDSPPCEASCDARLVGSEIGTSSRSLTFVQVSPAITCLVDQLRGTCDLESHLSQASFPMWRERRRIFAIAMNRVLH